MKARKKNRAAGARREREAVLEGAKKRADRREAEDRDLLVEADLTKVSERAARFMAAHKLPDMPAVESLVRVHYQMLDAVDTLYTKTVVEKVETREISAMVSAGKLAMAILNSLGIIVNLEDLEDDLGGPGKKPGGPPTGPGGAAAAGDDLDTWES